MYRSTVSLWGGWCYLAIDKSIWLSSGTGLSCTKEGIKQPVHVIHLTDTHLSLTLSCIARDGSWLSCNGRGNVQGPRLWVPQFGISPDSGITALYTTGVCCGAFDMQGFSLFVKVHVSLRICPCRGVLNHGMWLSGTMRATHSQTALHVWVQLCACRP